MSDKYNVLFMRDDKQVRRFRIGPTLLRVLLWAPALLVCMAVAGAWAGYTFWQQNYTLRTEQLELQQQLRKTEIQLERLENVQQILQSNDPEELQALFGTMSIEESSTQQPTIDLAKLLEQSDSRRVQIANMSLKANTNNTLRLSFDLNNLDTKTSIGGTIALAFITRDGQQLPIEADPEALKFSISRFKKIAPTIDQPENVAITDLYGLQVIITSKKTTLLQTIYPLQTILR